MNGRAFTRLNGLGVDDAYNDDEGNKDQMRPRKYVMPSRSQTDVSMYNDNIKKQLPRDISIEKILNREHKNVSKPIGVSKPSAMERYNSVAELNKFNAINMDKSENATNMFSQG